MKVRRIDYFPDEFLVGTAFMSNELVGAYWRICSLIYSKGGAIEHDLDRLGHYLRERPSTVRKLVDQLIGLGKLVANAGFLTNSRAETELEKVKTRSEESSKFGKTGGRGHKKQDASARENNDLGKASALGAEKPTTTTNHHHQPPKEGEIPPHPPAGKTAGKDLGADNDLLGQPAAKSTRQRKRQPLTALPAAWTVPIDWQDRALDIEGATPELIRREAAAFPDYWRGAGGMKADWEATFRNRIRHQIGQPNAHNSTSQNSQSVDRTRARREGISRALARELEPGSAGG